MRVARLPARPLSAVAILLLMASIAAACSGGRRVGSRLGRTRDGRRVDRALAGAVVRSADRPRHRHQQHHARHRDRAGEPFVRSLLRHVPGRRRLPARRERTHRRLRPRSRGRPLPAAVPRHEPVRRRRPPRAGRLEDLRERRADGRVRAGVGADRQRLRASSRRLPVPAGQTRAGGTARHHGVPHRQGDPELLGVREALRPAGPHVRAGVVVDAARAPVPGVGVGRHVPGSRRPDELSFGPGVPGRERRRPRQEDVDPGRRGAAPVRLGGHHVAAAPAPRELGVLRGVGDVPAARMRPLAGSRGHRARAEHAAGVQDRRGRPPAREHPVERALLRRGRRGHPAEGVVGDAHDEPRASTRRTTSGTARRG